MVSTELLRTLPFFAGLSQGQLDAVAALSVEHNFGPGVTIFQEGQPADKLYLTLRGSVDLYFSMEGRPKQRVLAGEVDAGMPVGISALIEPHMYMMTAKTATDCRMLEMDGISLRTLFESDTRMGYALMLEIAKASLGRLHLARVQLARELEPDLVI